MNIFVSLLQLSMFLALGASSHGTMAHDPVDLFESDADTSRGLRGTSSEICKAVGRMCYKNHQCCTGNCDKTERVCVNKRHQQCPIPADGQCHGKGYSGCKQCDEGSGCVYLTPDLSVCQAGSYVAVADDCVQQVGEQCGGKGYSGCQTCKEGSQCLEIDSSSSICSAEDAASN